MNVFTLTCTGNDERDGEKFLRELAESSVVWKNFTWKKIKDITDEGLWGYELEITKLDEDRCLCNDLYSKDVSFTSFYCSNCI